MSSEKEFLELSLGKGIITFQSQDQEEESFHQSDLIELVPYGMSVDVNRPFLLLHDKKHEHTLPVALNPLEAGVALSQANRHNAPITTHKFTQNLLKSLNIQIRQCVFVEIKGVHQYVRLYMTGHTGMSSMKLRADEAMSLCLYLEVPLFATKAFIAKSKIMSAEVQSMERDFSRSGSYIN